MFESIEALSPGAREALGILARLTGAGLAGGAAARFGLGALRAGGPAYDPPTIPKPIVVDVPVEGLPDDPTVAPPGRKALTKAADTSAPDWWPLGEQAWQRFVPTFHHPLGPDNPQTASDVPAYAAAAPVAGVGGLLGGFWGADRLMQAANRRGARRDLEAARHEYEQAVLDRAVGERGIPKEAADALLSGGVPADPALARAKAALDRAFEATKAANPQQGPADESWLGALFPGLLAGREGALANMAFSGTMGGLGGLLGYRYARDQDASAKLRKRVREVDQANALSTPAPVVARLIPVNHRQPAA